MGGLEVGGATTAGKGAAQSSDVEPTKQEPTAGDNEQRAAADGARGGAAPRGVGPFAECLELLEGWPEGAHAAAIGLLEEPAAKEEPAVRDLVRSLSAQR